MLAGLLCLGGAWQARREQNAWLLVGIGVLAWALGNLYYTVVLYDMESPPIPSPADAGFLLFPVLGMVGVLALVRARTHDVPKTLWTDGSIAALAVTAVSAAVIFQAAFDNVSGKTLVVATTLAYPLTDLLLIGVIVGALASTGWRMDRTWVTLAAGIGVFWVADSFYLVESVTGTLSSPSWYDIGWSLGLLLVALASWQPAAVRRPAEPEGLRFIAVPLGFGAVGLAMLIYGCLSDMNPVAVGLSALSLVAVMARLMLTFRENVSMLRTSRDEALTDVLTGLGNRRALARELAALLPEADDARPVVLVLFDLDGFKHYNDTFGHPAGDALLVRLGDNLATYLSGRGRAYRMGGDEFCALFEPGDEVADPIIAGAATALTEHGEGFNVTSSYGSIVLPREAQDATEALRIADQRMYAQKNAGRTSATRQSKDVLVRALTERAPELFAHLDGVADLAEATAKRLGMSDDEAECVRHAAELQDVGKVAIPDAILDQAGPARPPRVGVHPPPHADRRAHHLRRARAGRGRAARALLPRALGRHRLPGPPARAGDPHRLAGRRRRRRVRRDDVGAPVLAGGLTGGRARASSAAARARSSTRSWSRRSARRGLRVRARRRPTRAATSHPCRGRRAARSAAPGSGSGL